VELGVLSEYSFKLMAAQTALWAAFSHIRYIITCLQGIFEKREILCEFDQLPVHPSV